MNLRTLGIATFNLYNLNLPGRALYTGDGWTPEQYALKIEWTAHQIRRLSPDVFGFQELWHADALTAALERSGLTDDYVMVVPDVATGGRIVCAALVRKGLLGDIAPRWIADFPERFVLEAGGDDPQTPDIAVSIRGFSRPVLHFTIRPRSREPEVHVYVCHFKSKAPTKVYHESWYRADPTTYAKHSGALGSALSTIRRTAEAAALRFMLTEQMKGSDTPVIVLGDINDGQLSNTANVLTGQPRYLLGGSTGGVDDALYTAQTLQQLRDTRDVYYTHVHQGIRESLDHILVSEQFYDHSRKRRWLFDGMSIGNDHLNFEDHKADGTNDHGIVRAMFRFRPAR